MSQAARKQGVDEPEDDDRLFTTESVAKMFDISKSALQKAVERGRLVPDAPARKGLTRHHRFRRSTVLRYLTGVPSANQG